MSIPAIPDGTGRSATASDVTPKPARTQAITWRPHLIRIVNLRSFEPPCFAVDPRDRNGPVRYESWPFFLTARLIFGSAAAAPAIPLIHRSEFRRIVRCCGVLPLRRVGTNQK